MPTMNRSETLYKGTPSTRKYGILFVLTALASLFVLAAFFFPLLKNTGNAGMPVPTGRSISYFWFAKNSVTVMVGLVASLVSLVLAALKLHRFAFLPISVTLFGVFSSFAFAMFMGDWAAVSLTYGPLFILVLGSLLVFVLSLVAWIPFVRDRRRRRRSVGEETSTA